MNCPCLQEVLTANLLAVEVLRIDVLQILANLHDVKCCRGLCLLQEGTGAGPNWQWGSCHMPRGDLQTTFLFKGFDEARRLGLNRDTEAEVRAALAEETADTSAPGVHACCATTVHIKKLTSHCMCARAEEPDFLFGT